MNTSIYTYKCTYVNIKNLLKFDKSFQTLLTHPPSILSFQILRDYIRTKTQM